MPFLEVVIKSRSELAGFESATASIERQVGAAKAAGKAHDDLDARIAANKKVIADYQAANDTSNTTLGQSTAAQGAAAKSATTHVVSLEKLQRVFGALNEVIPGLGVLMQAAFSPIGAAISLAVMALSIFRGKMAEFNEECKRLEEQAARPLTNRMEAIRERTVNAATSMAALKDRLTEASRAEITLKDSTDQAIAAAGRQTAAAKSLADATKTNDLAAIELYHKAGLMSEQQFADRKLAIELDFQRKKRQSEQDALMRDILIKRRSLEQAKDQQPELEKKAEASLSAAVKAQEDLDAMPSRDEVKSRKESARKALQDFEGKLPKATQNLFNRVGVGGSLNDVDGVSYIGYEPQFSEWNRLQVADSLAQKEDRQYSDLRMRRELAKRRTATRADLEAKRLEENAAFIPATTRELAEQQDIFRETKAANTATARAETAAAISQRLAATPPDGMAAELNATPRMIGRQLQQAYRQGNQELIQLLQGIFQAQQSINNTIWQFEGRFRQQGNRTRNRSSY